MTKTIKHWWKKCNRTQENRYSLFIIERINIVGQVPVAQASNPSTLGGWGRQITRSGVWDQPGQYGEIPSLLKIQKLLQVACACSHSYLRDWSKESLEPRRRTLQWAKIVPLHSSLGNRARFCLKTKKELILLKCPYYPKQSTDSMKSLLQYQCHSSQE